MVFFKIKIARFLKIKLTFYEGGYDFEGCGSLFKIKGIFFKDQDHNQLFVDFECTFEDDGGLFNSTFYFLVKHFLLFRGRPLFYSFAELFFNKKHSHYHTPPPTPLYTLQPLYK